MSVQGDFNRGVCECGGDIYPVNRKYQSGMLVKSVNGRDLVWQWYCRHCGIVHHEPTRIRIHEEGGMSGEEYNRRNNYR